MNGHRFFFFQAEDGIRDPLVTGVQTCALPIWANSRCCWALVARAGTPAPTSDCGGRCYFPSTTASTTLSIASVTRLVGRLKLFVRIEKANCSPCLVVTYPERLFTPPRAPVFA